MKFGGEVVKAHDHLVEVGWQRKLVHSAVSELMR